MKDNLIAIYNLLNQLEVKGVQNISALYRIMAIVEKVLGELQQEEQEHKGG